MQKTCSWIGKTFGNSIRKKWKETEEEKKNGKYVKTFTIIKAFVNRDTSVLLKFNTLKMFNFFFRFKIYAFEMEQMLNFYRNALHLYACFSVFGISKHFSLCMSTYTT